MKSGLLALLFTTSILPALAQADDVQPPATIKVAKGNLIFSDDSFKKYFDGLYEPQKEILIKSRSNGKDGAPPIDHVIHYNSPFKSKDNLDKSNCIFTTEAAQNIVKLVPSPNSNMPLVGTFTKVEGPERIWKIIPELGPREVPRILYSWEGVLAATNNKDLVTKIVCKAEIFLENNDKRSAAERRSDAAKLIDLNLEDSGIHRKTPHPILEYERLEQLNLSEDKTVPTQA